LKNLISSSNISNAVWLGATDVNTEGSWQWVTGELWSYTAWASDQPDNSNDEDYLAFWTNNRDWNDYSISTSEVLYFIVEFD